MTEVRESLIFNAGKGVFSTRSFKKFDVVCTYNAIKKIPVTYKDNMYSIIGPNDEEYVGIEDTTHGTGQYVNDYANLSLLDFQDCDITHSEEKIQTYRKKSLSKCNVMFKKGTLDMIATRNIKKGEELYYHYGEDYWLSLMMQETTNPLFRLFCAIQLEIFDIVGECIRFNGKVFTYDTFWKFFRIHPEGNIIKKFNLTTSSEFEKIRFLYCLIQEN